ncbi:Phospholipase DDHD2-like isoform X1 [Oopsacas minuta]|uniref:Phospholipase DDHD2-like isoform X1 n=1 Tax=Oopsacas minuta TaxID=111878 RepID=A0AAV7KIJ6_9METZ|nr:Phospholipase DDHD2-like isoform X1 [Oopsacas minuta]
MFLPIAWHICLRSDYDNVDLRLDAISLTCTPKIRHFSNSVLTDILFYTSPLYCQTIIDTTTYEMNRLLSLYKARNPEFIGRISLIGHSLGSCILFDLLANQTKDLEPELTSPDAISSPDSFNPSSIDEVLTQLGLQDISHILSSQQIDMESLKMLSEGDLKELGISMGSRKKLSAYISEWKTRSNAKSEKRFLDGCPPPGEIQGYSIIKGVCGTGQISISYPKLNFELSFFFCIGSPIGLFLSVRGTQNLGYNFNFPTCGGFYHIYHPYDYVAYRIEPLIDPKFKSDPELLPHIRGGKRLHLELKENLERLGSELKQTIMYGVHSAVSSIQEFAKSHTMPEGTSKLIPPSIEEIKARQSISTSPEPPPPPPQFHSSLNQGQRVDYVLQVKGIEAINDYLFALSSHSCYWRSEDTVLFCLTKIFSSISS